MKLINNFKTQLTKIEISTKKNLYIYLFLVLIYSIVIVIYGHLYVLKYPDIIDENYNIILKNIGFNFGQILENFLAGEGLKAKYFGVDFYVSRMPLMPLFIAFVYSFISKNFFIILLFKNISLFSIIFFILSKYQKKNYYLFLLFSLVVFFYNPHNLVTTMSINFEEGFLNYFLIILFLLFFLEIKYKYVFVALVLSAIFFLKSSMIFLCIALSVFFCVIGFKQKKQFYYFPLLIFIISNIIWGVYSYSKTNYFAFGTTLTSYNGFTLQHAYHKDFNVYYPKISPDILSEDIRNSLPSKNYKNEWEINSFYYDSSINYLKKNQYDILKSFVKKLQVVFFYLYEDSQWPNLSGETLNKFRFSNIPNKLFFIIFIFLLIKKIIYHFDEKAFFLIILNFFYFFPYMVGFVYTRHCTSMYMIATYFVIYELFKNKFKREFF